MGLGAESAPERFFRKTAVLLDDADMKRGERGLGEAAGDGEKSGEKCLKTGACCVWAVVFLESPRMKNVTSWRLGPLFRRVGGLLVVFSLAACAHGSLPASRATYGTTYGAELEQGTASW